VNVSKEMAIFFKDQLVGTYSGHMAAIPNNPVLYGLMAAHKADNSNRDFAEFLRQVADKIDPQE